MDPVTAADGEDYERWAIRRYFRERQAVLEAVQRALDGYGATNRHNAGAADRTADAAKEEGTRSGQTTHHDDGTGEGESGRGGEGERVRLMMALASGLASPMGHGMLTSTALVTNRRLARRAAEWLLEGS